MTFLDSAFGLGLVPTCYECRQPAEWISAEQWSRNTRQPLDRSGSFPLHLALFWYCPECDLSGARLHLP